MQKIEALAAEMNVSTADLMGFIAGLSVWINKGYSVDQAIERHMAQMTRFVNNAVPASQAMKGQAVECFYG